MPQAGSLHATGDVAFESCEARRAACIPRWSGRSELRSDMQDKEGGGRTFLTPSAPSCAVPSRVRERGEGDGDAQHSTRAGTTSRLFACESSRALLLRALCFPSPPVRRPSPSRRRFDAFRGNVHVVRRHLLGLVRASEARPPRLLTASPSAYGRTDVRTSYPPTTVLQPNVRSRVEEGGGASERFLFGKGSLTEWSGFETERGRGGRAAWRRRLESATK